MTMLDYSAIFDASPDARFTLNKTGQFLTENLSAVKHHGYPLEELRRMNAADLAVDDLSINVSNHLNNPLKSDERFEWRHRCKDDGELPVDIPSHPITHQGWPVIPAGVRDISQHKQAD